MASMIREILLFTGVLQNLRYKNLYIKTTIPILNIFVCTNAHPTHPSQVACLYGSPLLS
jgi:hypothetical protein